MSQTVSPGPSRKSSRFAKMVGSSRLSEDEMALAALNAYESNAKNPFVYNKIKNYAGGTAYLVEFTNDSGSQSYWSVLLRNGETQVFYDYEMLLREAVLYQRRVSGVSLGGLVIALISILIVAAFVWEVLSGKTAADQSLNYALSSVLGFWFGKTITRSNPGVGP